MATNTIICCSTVSTSNSAVNYQNTNTATVESMADGYISGKEGPNSFQPSDAVLTMAVDSGLKDELVFGDPNAPRFVLWNGKLRPVPSKPTDLPFFDLMSFPARLGLHSVLLAYVLLLQFCPPLYCVYAGDPSKLSMKAAFGKVWILEQKGVVSLAACSKVKLSWTLSSIVKLPNGEYNLTYETPDGLVSVRTRSVVMTVPSHIAS
uniref:Amine oxidase domain-containing protein n=1 Tax=Chenopodium quinoa TaxID=63459 RepID=A0A803NDK8_CHEQI